MSAPTNVGSRPSYVESAEEDELRALAQSAGAGYELQHRLARAEELLAALLKEVAPVVNRARNRLGVLDLKVAALDAQAFLAACDKHTARKVGGQA